MLSLRATMESKSKWRQPRKGQRSVSTAFFHSCAEAAVADTSRIEKTIHRPLIIGRLHHCAQSETEYTTHSS